MSHATAYESPGLTNFQKSQRLAYTPSLDGIRAVAILAVVVFHVAPGLLRGGFTGVDVFFVLSGFLITSTILYDMKTRHFSFREFYLRRIQRLLPNIIVTVVATVALWTFLMPPSAVLSVAEHGIWTLFDASNFYILRKLGGYWGNDAEWAPLTHTWSLGIEEQFYLFFPFYLLFLVRMRRLELRRWLAGATALSFALSLAGIYLHTGIAFYMLPTRGWQLLAGALLAAYKIQAAETKRSDEQGQLFGFSLRPIHLEILGWLGLAIIVAGFVGIDGAKSNYPGLQALAPTIGSTLLVLSVTETRNRLFRFLSTPLMVAIGRGSYSLYLWHWPLIVCGKLEADLYGFPQIIGALLGALVSIPVSWLVYRAIERPLRKRGAGRGRRLALIGIGFAIATICCVVAVSHRPEVDPQHRFNRPAFYGKVYDTGRPLLTNPASTVRYYDVYFPPLPSAAMDQWRNGGIIHRYGGGNPQVVVLGSSHALMYSKMIDDICREQGVSVAFLGVDNGISPFFETNVGTIVSLNPNFSSPREAKEFDETRRRYLKQWNPKAIFMIDRWDGHEPGQLEKQLPIFLKQLDLPSAHIFFVAQVPVLAQGSKINLRGYVGWRMRTKAGLPTLAADGNRSKRLQQVENVQRMMQEFPSLQVLRPDSWFAMPDGNVRYALDRDFYYVDDNHLSETGAEKVSPMFSDAIAETRSELPLQ